MTTPTRHTMIPRRRPCVRPGFTLAELMVSMTIMTILMGAMTSVILVASHAIPDNDDPLLKKMEAMDLVDQIAGELFYATSISEAATNAVTFTVADRGHGAAGPETIRYAWSGTTGDPLTRQYNGGTVVTLSETVRSFTLAYSKAVTELLGPPCVLFFVSNPDVLVAEEVARKAVFESWGFSVDLMSQGASIASFSGARPTCDVIYVSPSVNWAIMGTLPKNVPMGVVVAKGTAYNGYGISGGSSSYAGDSIDITDNVHPITSGFPIGTLTICSSSQPIAVATASTGAPGARPLAWEPGGAADKVSLLTIELDGQLSTGETANGRRVSVPSGDDLFEFNSLNKAGLQLERRAIVWAAAPVVYSAVRIVLQPSGNLVSAVETETQILNMPKVNTP